MLEPTSESPTRAATTREHADEREHHPGGRGRRGPPATAGHDVVGAPTHAFGLSRANTRHDAVTKAPSPVPEPETGAREWLGTLARAGDGVRAASFDTRIGRGWVPRSAARAALRRLGGPGYSAATPPESFYVVGSTGPLADGEEERARQWGFELGAEIAHLSPA